MGKIKELLKSKKFWIATIIIIILLGLFLINKLQEELPKEEEGQPSKKIDDEESFETPINPTVPVYRPKGVYYINTIIDSKTPVNGFSWTPEDLITYSTPKGIYKANDNLPLKETPIEYISWSDTGVALFKSDGKWQIFRPDETETRIVNSNFLRPVISPDGNYALDYSGGNLNLFNFSSNTTQKYQFDSNISQVVWSIRLHSIAVNTEKANTNQITVLDSSLKTTKVFELEKGSILLSFSPDAKKVAAQLTSGIFIYDLDENDTTSITIKENSDSVASWIDNESFFLSESYLDELGRQIDNFYLADTSGEKNFLTNSMPIIYKLNRNLQPKVNNAKNTILFAENNSKLWILSLMSNTMPTYSTDGLHTNIFESKSHGFVEP